MNLRPLDLAFLMTACAMSCNSAAHDPPGSNGAADASSIGFDRLAEGALPAGWHVDATNPEGPTATWSVRRDASPRSTPNVISLTQPNHSGQDTFNLCWTKDTRFKDGALEVAVRADGGEVDQGGGLVWRVRDADNYYISRFNPLESNFRVYVVKNGKRTQLATAQVHCGVGEWHSVQIDHVGTRIVCSMDGKKLLEAQDGAFPDEGGIGFWTKADARTSFDDLRVTARAD